jgi:hypothetical protein
MNKLRNGWLLSLMLVLLVSLATGCNPKGDNLAEGPMSKNEEAVEPTDEETVQRMALEALVALKAKNMEAIAGMAHSEGIRFSPYTYVNPEKDQVLTPEQISEAMNSSQVVTWGTYDGRGDSIDLTFPEYYDQFVFDHDYTVADETSLDRVIGKGNTLNNINEVYADAHVVEYHFKGFDVKNEGMDWTSLRLVFTKENDEDWRLRGIVHDQWTI